MRTLIFPLAAAVLATAGAANAASLEIHDAVARVTIIPEDRQDIAVEILRRQADLPITVRKAGDVTRIEGDVPTRLQTCRMVNGQPQVSARRRGPIAYDDMPILVIRTPRRVSAEAEGAIYGTVGRSLGLELVKSGCGNWTVANVDGPLTVREAGAGTLRLGSAGQTRLQLSGASDVHAKTIRGPLDIRLSGAGKVMVDELRGPLDAVVSGVGQIRVLGGRAETMRAAVSGMGGVDFGGVAGSLRATISGFGNIWVREVTGQVVRSVSGGGRITVDRESL